MLGTWMEKEMLSLEEIQARLWQMMRGDDVAIRFVAAKVLEGIDRDGSATLSPAQFRDYAAKVYQKYTPGLLAQAEDARNPQCFRPDCRAVSCRK